MPLQKEAVWLVRSPRVPVDGGKDCPRPCLGMPAVYEDRADGLACGICPMPPQRESGTVPGKEPQKDSLTPPKVVKQEGGKMAPGLWNMLEVFFLFFHLALRFWNHTCQHTHTHSIMNVKCSRANIQSAYGWVAPL